jgi:hypothetical protein
MYVTRTGALYTIIFYLPKNYRNCTVVSDAEPEPKLRIAAPAPLYLLDLKKFYRKKTMHTEEVFVNCYNFNPITKVKKGNFQDTASQY